MQKKWKAFCRKIDTKTDGFNAVMKTIEQFLNMISAVGRAYLTSNIENNEYNYPKAFSAASLTFAPVQNSAGRRLEKLDIRFEKEYIQNGRNP